MLNSSKRTQKSKLTKNTIPRLVLPPSEVDTTLQSGITSTQRSLRKIGSSHSVRSNQSRRHGDRAVSPAPENSKPLIRYHQWEPDYIRIYTREKAKKSMTKDPYKLLKYSYAQATETITTEKECCPVIIPANAVRIEQPIVHKQKIKLPNIVRYIRMNDLLPAQQSTIKHSSVSQLQIEIKESVSVINTNKLQTNVPTLATTERLLNRSTIRNDVSVIRRPPRRLLINITRETLPRLSVYG